jgi:hypothetical protein
MGKPLTLPTNVGVGWKQLTVTNTLAYYNNELITVVKSFIVQAYDQFYKMFLQCNPCLRIISCLICHLETISSLG